jgi:hypothetical protein
LATGRIRVGALRELFGAVLPHTGLAGSGPLRVVHLEAVGGALVAVATDLRTLAACRWAPDSSGGEELAGGPVAVTVDAVEARLLLKAFPEPHDACGPRRSDPDGALLTVAVAGGGGGGLRVGCGGKTQTVQTAAGGFPVRWRRMLAGLVGEHAVVDAGGVALGVDLLARFDSAPGSTGEPLRMLPHGARGALAVTCGQHFLAAVLPPGLAPAAQAVPFAGSPWPGLLAVR